jgi:hypothetical protein
MVADDRRLSFRFFKPALAVVGDLYRFMFTSYPSSGVQPFGSAAAPFESNPDRDGGSCLSKSAKLLQQLRTRKRIPSVQSDHFRCVHQALAFCAHEVLENHFHQQSRQSEDVEFQSGFTISAKDSLVNSLPTTRTGSRYASEPHHHTPALSKSSAR